MRNQLIWTVVCSVIASVVAAVLFKEAGIDSAGWAGGIGAGLGVVGGTLIAAKLDKKDKNDEGGEGGEES